MIPDRLRRLRHPEIFQGNLRRAPYFEGWYFKLVTADAARSLAIIPGVSLSKNKSHAFIQVMDSVTRETLYFEYDIRHFYASADRFEVRIHGSVFSGHDLSLNTWQGTDRIVGGVRFENPEPFPVSLRRPGIMGWYAYAPFMECYHAVVSMNHRLYGSLDINGRHYDFNNGKGYIEKDWGRSFPKSWIWLQSNQFEDTSASFMFSVARIPWVRSVFTGFLGYLKVKDRLYTFATYTGAKIVSVRVEESVVNVVLQDRHHRLAIMAHGSAGQQALLRAPVLGEMDRHIKESIDSEIEVTLTETAGRVIFSGKGVRAGMEVQGSVASFSPVA